MKNKLLLKIGDMYIVKSKLYCIKKTDEVDVDSYSFYKTVETKEIMKNNFIMYLGSQKVDKTGKKYSLIMQGQDVYFTYNPLKLQDYVRPL